MVQTIPQPVLDVIATYCKTSKANIRPIIEHAIHDLVGGNPVLVSHWSDIITRAIENDVDPIVLGAVSIALGTKNQLTSGKAALMQQAQNPVLTGTLLGQTQTVTPTPIGVRQSPHSPKRGTGPKLPYWFKVVTSIDRSAINGYGLKGKFVNPDDLHKEQHGRIVVCQMKDFKTKSIMLYVLDVDASSRTKLNLPSGVPISVSANLICSFNNYIDLFDFLEKNHGIPS